MLPTYYEFLLGLAATFVSMSSICELAYRFFE